LKSIPSLSYGDIAARLGISFGLGGLIGLQREIDSHPAGLRTHVLVSLGATLFTLVGGYGFSEFNQKTKSFDPSRIAAQVVSGIGFLGGGAIVKTGGTIQGLTTAATLWISSAIGVAVGANFWFGAIVATAISLITLELLKWLEILYWTRRNTHYLKIEKASEDTVSKVVNLLIMNHVEIKKIFKTSEDKETNRFTVLFQLLLPKSLRSTPFLMASILQGVEGVIPSELVLMDDHDCHHYLKEVSKDIRLRSERELADDGLPVSEGEFGAKFMQDSNNMADADRKNRFKRQRQRRKVKSEHSRAEDF